MQRRFAEIYSILKRLGAAKKLEQSGDTHTFSGVELLKCLCPPAVWAVRGRVCMYVCMYVRACQCFNLIHIFISRQKC